MADFGIMRNLISLSLSNKKKDVYNLIIINEK